MNDKVIGKIKNVMFLEKRIKQAEKMWFETIYIPELSTPYKGKIKTVPLKNISDLVIPISIKWFIAILR